MRAVTVEPGRPGSVRLDDIAEPDPRNGSVLVEAIAVGGGGTDNEIAEGKYEWTPPGKARLVLGHESLGRVVDPGEAGARKGISSRESFGGPIPSRVRTARSANGICVAMASTPSAGSKRSMAT